MCVKVTCYGLFQFPRKITGGKLLKVKESVMLIYTSVMNIEKQLEEIKNSRATVKPTELNHLVYLP